MLAHIALGWAGALGLVILIGTLGRRRQSPAAQAAEDRAQLAFIDDWKRRRLAKREARDRCAILQAFDDSIALAKRKHRPTGSLQAAKGDFLRQALR